MTLAGQLGAQEVEGLLALAPGDAEERHAGGELARVRRNHLPQMPDRLLTSHPAQRPGDRAADAGFLPLPELRDPVGHPGTARADLPERRQRRDPHTPEPIPARGAEERLHHRRISACRQLARAADPLQGEARFLKPVEKLLLGAWKFHELHHVVLGIERHVARLLGKRDPDRLLALLRLDR